MNDLIIYQSEKPTIRQSGEKAYSLSNVGNRIFGNTTRTGWKVSNLGKKKKALILKALNDSYIDKVYRVNNEVHALYLNGTIEKIA